MSLSYVSAHCTFIHPAHIGEANRALASNGQRLLCASKGELFAWEGYAGDEQRGGGSGGATGRL